MLDFGFVLISKSSIQNQASKIKHQKSKIKNQAFK